MSDAGIKFDNAKPMFGLLPWEPLRQAVWVLMFGKEKYDIDNWQKLEDGQRRYLESMTRHMAELWEGLSEGKELHEILDNNDPGGSRMPVIAHIVCCALFAMWFSRDDFAHDYDVDWVAPFFEEQRRLARATEELDEDGNATAASALAETVNCRSAVVGLENYKERGGYHLTTHEMQARVKELYAAYAKARIPSEVPEPTDAENDLASRGMLQDDGTFDSRIDRLREAEERIEAARIELGTALCEKSELLSNPAVRS